MIFHSIDFLVFFLVVLGIYWMLPRWWQNVLLIPASYFFYGYVTHWWVLLLIATTFLDFFAARQIEDHPKWGKVALGVILTVNFSLLAVMKYGNFLTENLQGVADLVGIDWNAPHWKVMLPVGISFYTFQSCAYVVDVYRGRIKASRSIVDYASYLCFFPQLVAGPIERAGDMLVQFQKSRRIDFVQMRHGLVLILWGLFKKMVIADNVAIYCNKVYGLEDPSFPLLWAGTFCFCIQIYADFSGYTDMARGVAKWLGFELMLNFRHPYAASSPVDFWRRWHISLSNWFRDYVYIPLGGSRCGEGRILFNLMATFLLSGLWHGASWNFIIWGAWHGAILVVWRCLDNLWHGWKNPRSWWLRSMQWAITFGLVNVGWMFFREHDIVRLWQHLQLNPWVAGPDEWRAGAFFAVTAALFSIPLVVDAVMEKQIKLWAMQGDSRSVWLLQAGAGIFLLTCTVLAATSVKSDFIYFQF
jgi:D-alanyl-lipoteichoic acid acyltransferase DltB (MBOAT superfamily)